MQKMGFKLKSKHRIANEVDFDETARPLWICTVCTRSVLVCRFESVNSLFIFSRSILHDEIDFSKQKFSSSAVYGYTIEQVL